MKRPFISLILILFSSLAYNQIHTSLYGNSLSRFKSIKQTNEGKIIARIEYPSIVTFSAKAFYQFEVKSKMYDVDARKWEDVTIKLRLVELEFEKNEGNSIHYLFKSKISENDTVGDGFDSYISLRIKNGLPYEFELLLMIQSEKYGIKNTSIYLK